MKNSTILFLALFFFVVQSKAQVRVIQGIVTTFDSIAVNGAQIKISSSKERLFSDAAGNFTAKVSETDKLKITADGFYNQLVKTDAKTKVVAINLKLKPGNNNKEHALGMISISDHEKLNALAGIDANTIDFSIYPDIFEAVEGRIPNVSASGGEFFIRGSTSISGPTPALIVVDGVTTPASAVATMNPATVKSINVIKDGSSAIYGSRGANGVVIIETKKGGE